MTLEHVRPIKWSAINMFREFPWFQINNSLRESKGIEYRYHGCVTQVQWHHSQWIQSKLIRFFEYACRTGTRCPSNPFCSNSPWPYWIATYFQNNSLFRGGSSSLSVWFSGCASSTTSHSKRIVLKCWLVVKLLCDLRDWFSQSQETAPANISNRHDSSLWHLIQKEKILLFWLCSQ